MYDNEDIGLIIIISIFILICCVWFIFDNIYNSNNLKHDIKKKFKKNEYKQIVNYMSADKKNNDKKINLILLRK